MKGRITPYLFFALAALALSLIALSPNDDWHSAEVDPLNAVLIVAGVFIGAHLLRKLAEAAVARWKDRER